MLLTFLTLSKTVTQRPIELNLKQKCNLLSSAWDITRGTCTPLRLLMETTLTRVPEMEWSMVTMEKLLTPKLLCSRSHTSTLDLTSLSKLLKHLKPSRALNRTTISIILASQTTLWNWKCELIISVSKSRQREVTIHLTSWLKTNNSTETWEILTLSEALSLMDREHSTATLELSLVLKLKQLATNPKFNASL